MKINIDEILENFKIDKNKTVYMKETNDDIFLKDVEREIDYLEYISACGAFVDEYLNKFYLLRKYLFKQKLESQLSSKNKTKGVKI